MSLAANGRSESTSLLLSSGGSSPESEQAEIDAIRGATELVRGGTAADLYVVASSTALMHGATEETKCDDAEETKEHSRLSACGRARILLRSHGPYAYVRGLSAAFGAQYVAIVVAEYGMNQGLGLRLVSAARSYYLLDRVGMTSSEYGHLSGFIHIPWQLKSLFGLLSDTVSINGLHRTPFLVLAGVVGLCSSALLAILPVAAVSHGVAACLLLGTNWNVAMADVMVDATVAQRAKQRPELAADMQALCWASLGSFGVPAALISGVLLSHFGPRLLFSVAAIAATSIVFPAAAGWLGEKRAAHARSAPFTAVRRRCAEVFGDPIKRRVAAAALLVGAYSVSLGLLQVSLGSGHPLLAGSLTAGGNLALCLSLYALLRAVDGCLARAIVYAFLQNALCPSSSVLFEWSHAPTGDASASSDHRCFSAEQCTNVTHGAELPCGWARARGAPCLSPLFYSLVQVAGSAALVSGTALYTACFQAVAYRKIIGTTQLLLVAVNMLDLVWVSRLNLRIGLPDAAFLFTDEIVADVVERLNAMPFFIYAAKLCPPTVEGSMFALFMGLSNFGSASGSYLGSALLRLLGGVRPPAFARLQEYIVLRSLMRIIPVLLVPALVPRGSPRDTAREMGAGAAITGDEESVPDGEEHASSSYGGALGKKHKADV
uniref:Uncharacterized protein n=1 Tax=Calcidiscus leptoporus TaxID=127549 RepID=A0A7S0J6I0_9EUKA|mmetsp:Transcript_41867/g.98085  ORF Transcript_41867/g.98085 Transcript_41867/m.98085 type:complete len:661 (+) Transcript_41867:76-2058(+)